MAIGKRIKSIGKYFRMSPSERRGVLVLLPLLAVAALLIHGLGRPKSDGAFLEEADGITGSRAESYTEAADSTGSGLFFFDPNTVTIDGLCALGFELRTAASIIKYRDGGKVFEVAEDLAMCYGVTLEQYLAVEPYIIIGERYRRKARPAAPGNDTPRPGNKPPRSGITVTDTFIPNDLEEAGFMALGFTGAQARTIINYRNSIGGFTSAEQFGRCYAVSDDVLQTLLPFMVFEPASGNETDAARVAGTETAVVFPVEINSADSASLRAVSGIGEVTVVRIMEYRGNLGGFFRVEQLAEVRGMTAANYERIIQQITVDSCNISKIDINFAPHKELAARLESHPYVTSRMAGKLLSVRQLKGGWSNTRELIEDKILTKEEAEKLAPYLLFQPFEKD